MLEPDDRRYLLDVLRPPPGHCFDRAVGTTYSLDLLALLTAPLGLAMHEAHESDGTIAADPLAWMESLRRYAGRIGIFCQAGRVSVPPQDLFLNYLEHSVVEVAPERGVFHPKVWALRFVDEQGTPRYRVLCSTRNLTFDRSWDTMLVLDGELRGDGRDEKGARPLAEFFAALPGLALRGIPEAVSAHCALISSELGMVRFAPPDGFDSIRFLPLGIGTRRWPFESGARRVLIVSPFLTASQLGRLAATRARHILISRPESIDTLGSSPAGASALANFERAYVLADDVDLETIETVHSDEPTPDAASSDAAISDSQAPGASAMRADTDAAEGSDTVRLSSRAEPLSGLHAKLFVLEYSAEDVRLFTGSANATHAAFNDNVEFLVELRGVRRTVGIDALIGTVDDGQMRLGHILRPYTALAAAQSEPTVAVLDSVRDCIARASFTGQVVPHGDGYILSLVAGDELVLTEGVDVGVRPASLAPARALPLTPAATMTFDMSFEALTTFIAFDLRTIGDGPSESASFVINVPVSGMPEDRSERLLLAFLGDRRRVLRLLRMLLADDFSFGLGLSGADASPGAYRALWQGFDTGLFEALVRSASRYPERFERIDRLIDELSRSGGAELLPEGFAEIWGPLREAWRAEHIPDTEKCRSEEDA